MKMAGITFLLFVYSNHGVVKGYHFAKTPCTSRTALRKHYFPAIVKSSLEDPHRCSNSYENSSDVISEWYLFPKICIWGQYKPVPQPLEDCYKWLKYIIQKTTKPLTSHGVNIFEQASPTHSKEAAGHFIFGQACRCLFIVNISSCATRKINLL